MTARVWVTHAHNAQSHTDIQAENETLYSLCDRVHLHGTNRAWQQALQPKKLKYHCISTYSFRFECVLFFYFHLFSDFLFGCFEFVFLFFQLSLHVFQLFVVFVIHEHRRASNVLSSYQHSSLGRFFRRDRAQYKPFAVPKIKKNEENITHQMPSYYALIQTHRDIAIHSMCNRWLTYSWQLIWKTIRVHFIRLFITVTKL